MGANSKIKATVAPAALAELANNPFFRAVHRVPKPRPADPPMIVEARLKAAEERRRRRNVKRAEAWRKGQR